MYCQSSKNHHLYFITKPSLRLFVLFLSILILSCSSKDSSKGPEGPNTVVNELSAALSKVGISTPTALTSSSTSIFTALKPPRPSKIKKFEDGEILTVNEQVAAIEEQSTQATDSACFNGVSLNIAFQETMVSCFAPNIAVNNSSNYPNESGETANSSLPKGDFGIFKAAESNGEACISAKMNSLVGDAANIIFETQKVFAAILCSANLNNMDLPAAGESLNLLSILSGKMNQTTFSEATLAKAASDNSGESTYTLRLVGTYSSSSFSLTSIKTSSSTEQKGIIYGYLPDGVTPTNVNGFSTVYSQTDSTHKVEMKTIAIDTSHVATLFNSTSHVVDFISATGNNLYYILSEINPTNNLGKLYMSWQAGGGDSHSRVFRTQTVLNSTTGIDEGFGYFAYGDKMNQGTPSLGTIKGMICNWVASSNAMANHSTYLLDNKVQSQKITRDAVTGAFVPAAGQSNIKYCPTYNCNNQKLNNSNGGVFSLTLLNCPGGAATCNPSDQVASTNPNDTVSYSAGEAHSLATLGSAGYTNVDSITAPTYP